MKTSNVYKELKKWIQSLLIAEYAISDALNQGYDLQCLKKQQLTPGLSCELCQVAGIIQANFFDVFQLPSLNETVCVFQDFMKYKFGLRINI